MQRINWKSIAFSTIVAAAVVAPSLASANWPNYKIHEIAGFQSYSNSALSINTYNKAAGNGFYGAGTQSYTGIVASPGSLTDFFIPPNNWNAVQWNGINSDDVTVGYTVIGGVYTAVRYQKGTPANNLVSGLSSTVFSSANAINHAGMVVGNYKRNEGGKVNLHMFRWDPNTKTRTGDWLNLLPGGINDNGMMVAQNIYPTNFYKLCELVFVPPTGNTTTVTAPGYYLYMQPNSISAGGGITVVGDMLSYIQNASNSYKNGFVYNKSSNIWSYLNGPGGVNMETHGLGVDTWGTRAVGSTVDSNGLQRAAVWEYQSGQWVESDLASLVPSDPNWQYIQATAISSLGAISGIGNHFEGGQWVQRAFIATPNNFVTIPAVEGGFFGGETVNPAVKLGGMDPYTIDVNLGSPSRAVYVPPVLRIPAQHYSAPFTMQTEGVDANTQVEVHATLGGVETTTVFTLRQAILSSMAIQNSESGRGGRGRIMLRGLAGPSGATVRLTSSNPNITVPSSVKVERGGGGANFLIALLRGAKKGDTTTITAYYCDGSVSQPFVVN